MSYKCNYCGYYGQFKDFHIDHIIPISRSPLAELFDSNKQIICSGCNLQKGRMTHSEYISWRLNNPSRANYGPAG